MKETVEKRDVVRETAYLITNNELTSLDGTNKATHANTYI